MEYSAFKEKYRKIYNPTIIEKIEDPKTDFKNAKIIIFLIVFFGITGFVYYKYYKKRHVSKLFFQ